MGPRNLAFAAVLGAVALASAPAVAGLAGAYVEAVSYFNVSDPPPAPTGPISASTPPGDPDCTMITYCNIINYPIGGGSSQNNPLTTVPATGGLNFVLDSLSLAYVSVFDKEITITYNSDLTFCYNPGQCGGPFSGFGFYFSNGVDITKVTASGSSSFQPIPGGLSSSPTTILVNLNGDAPAMNDELVLNVYFAGGGPSNS